MSRSTGTSALPASNQLTNPESTRMSGNVMRMGVRNSLLVNEMPEISSPATTRATGMRRDGVSKCATRKTLAAESIRTTAAGCSAVRRNTELTSRVRSLKRSRSTAALV